MLKKNDKDRCKCTCTWERVKGFWNIWESFYGIIKAHLGFLGLTDLNEALFDKCLYRFTDEQESLWRATIVGIFREEGGWVL